MRIVTAKEEAWAEARAEVVTRTQDEIQFLTIYALRHRQLWTT